MILVQHAQCSRQAGGTPPASSDLAQAQGWEGVRVGKVVPGNGELWMGLETGIIEIVTAANIIIIVICKLQKL